MFWVTSLHRVFDASLAPETCLEFPVFANLIQDSIRQTKAETSLVLCARSQAWLRYWRSLAWWQGDQPTFTTFLFKTKCVSWEAVRRRCQNVRRGLRLTRLPALRFHPVPPDPASSSHLAL